jgi:hypothetical protein
MLCVVMATGVNALSELVHGLPTIQNTWLSNPCAQILVLGVRFRLRSSEIILQYIHAAIT